MRAFRRAISQLADALSMSLEADGQPRARLFGVLVRCLGWCVPRRRLDVVVGLRGITDSSVVAAMDRSGNYGDCRTLSILTLASSPCV